MLHAARSKDMRDNVHLTYSHSFNCYYLLYYTTLTVTSIESTNPIFECAGRIRLAYSASNNIPASIASVDSESLPSSVVAARNTALGEKSWSPLRTSC